KTKIQTTHKEDFKIKGVHLFNEKPIVHKLSHQHLHTLFWIVELNGVLHDGISFNEVQDYAVPVLISDFIKAFKNSYF
ncbi:MAG: A/G-specific adenine glycosylase, partial [Bacteroidota bacterium]